MSKRAYKSLPVLIVFGMLVSTFAGCSSEGGSSPEDVFAKMKTAAKNKDYEGMVKCMDSKSQEQMAVGMFMMSSMMKGFAGLGGDGKGKEAAEKIDGVLKKHNLDDIDEKEMEKFANDKDGAMKFLGSKIKDKAGFVGDLMTAMESMGDGKEKVAPEIEGELEDVEIDGDTATGTIVMKGKNEPIKFVKENGRWKISMDEKNGPLGM